MDFYETILKRTNRLTSETPGVYQYLTNKDEIIYIGKAKIYEKG